MKVILYIAVLLILVGCGRDNLEFRGKCSFEDSKKNTLTNVKAILAQDGCHEVNKIEHSFIDYDEKKNITREHWIISGCSKTFNYLVRYQQENCKRLYTGVSRIK